MKQPATPLQRLRQKLYHQLSNGLNRATKMTPVNGRTDIPPRGCPAKIHPPKVSSLFPIPLKIPRHPNFPGGRRPPIKPNNYQVPLTSTKQLPGILPFQEVALPFLPLISKKKKLSGNNYRDGIILAPSLAPFRNQQPMVGYSELLYSFFTFLLAVIQVHE